MSDKIKVQSQIADSRWKVKNFVPIMEKGGRESIVDKLGYVPSAERIARMQRSGIRLAAASAELYDGVEVPGQEFVVPPWRKRDFDIAEGAQYLRDAAKLKEQMILRAKEAKRQELLKAKAEAEAAQQPQTVQGEAPAAGKQGRAAPAEG